MFRTILLAVTLINFKLLPLDRVSIETPNRAISGEYVVSTDGFLSIPLVGDIAAAGRTPAEFLDTLADRAKSSGIVLGGLEVKLVGTARLDVTFSGAVQNPGAIVWREGLTVGDVTSLAKPRPGSVANVETPVRVVLKAVGASHRLSRGDRVIFAAPSVRNAVLVLGAVRNPGEYEFVEGAKVEEALELAGGLTVHANLREAKHTTAGQSRTLDVSATLKPGDILHIPLVENPKVVTVAGTVSRPGKVGFVAGMTLTKALEAVGWPLHNADQRKVTILRVADGKSKIHTVDFAAIKAGKLRDFVLMPGDLIEVPKKR